jgi:hypothetical protein
MNARATEYCAHVRRKKRDDRGTNRATEYCAHVRRKKRDDSGTNIASFIIWGSGSDGVTAVAKTIT